MPSYWPPTDPDGTGGCVGEEKEEEVEGEGEGRTEAAPKGYDKKNFDTIQYCHKLLKQNNPSLNPQGTAERDATLLPIHIIAQNRDGKRNRL